MPRDCLATESGKTSGSGPAEPQDTGIEWNVYGLSVFRSRVHADWTALTIDAERPASSTYVSSGPGLTWRPASRTGIVATYAPGVIHYHFTL